MNAHLAPRMQRIKPSFIREILKAGDDPDVISFAGGLPNPEFFPVEAISAASQKVLSMDGANVLQYSTTEGYPPLREFIARRYSDKYGLNIDASEILIINGSQQGLDLIGKLFLDKDDAVVIERPGYLGAIQALSIYEPILHSVPLLADGIDVAALELTFKKYEPKLFYAVPSFQNPSGLSYSAEKRRAVGHLLQSHNVLFIEDNPYGELRFSGEDVGPIWPYAEEQTLMLGSFSKIVAPGLRMGWICAKSEWMKKLIIAKQASDLHSNYFAQRVIYQFLQDNDLDVHIERIKTAYKQQCDLMVEMIDELFPPEIEYVCPEGGMFLWLTLPEQVSAFDLFDQAIQLKVAFVPGGPFYVDGGGKNTLRLNYSNADASQIEQGMQRLGEAIKKMM